MGAFPKKRAWLLVLLLWLGLIAAGYAWLLRYGFAPGKIATAPGIIPPSLAPSNYVGHAQLFLALHPRCPCSRATVKELAKILSRIPGTINTTVLVYKPASEGESWLQSSLLDECRHMNCRVLSDPDGRLAASLGSLTSGNVVLYDANGKLRYQGGITASRGHEGDSAGQRAVLEILSGSCKSYKSMPVFGCPIQQSETRQ
jgi:hypothetical protein